MNEQANNPMNEEIKLKPKKKKIYKRWWFWVIIVVGFLLIVSMFGEDEPVEEVDSTQSSTVTTQIVTTTKAATTQENREDYMAKCKKYTYNELARNPDNYKKQDVVFKGEVIQVMENGNDVSLRINVTDEGYGYYSDTVYVTYTRKSSEGRILEEDIVTFYGSFEGLMTYTSVLGAEITIPHVDAKYIVIS